MPATVSGHSLPTDQQGAHGSGGGPPRGDHLIVTEHLTKNFRRGSEVITAVKDVSLEIRKGEFVCLIGPSGCGKSTLLNLTAGLLAPSKGKISYAGAPVPTPNTDVGYVTQSDNLMPWRTTRRNISFGLEIQKVPAAERDERVDRVIQMVGLEGFEDSYPNQLSGGMRKRASLARTLVCEPRTILADEPFGALDAQLKLLLQSELLRLWKSLDGRTVLFVTHDLTEAITLADRVIVMTRRPGEVKLDCPIDLPRPRDVMNVRFTPRFGELHEQLWDALKEDMAAGEDAL